jgi:hypothetical protein
MDISPTFGVCADADLEGVRQVGEVEWVKND